MSSNYYSPSGLEAMAFAKGGNSLVGHASSLPSEASAFSYPIYFYGSYCKNTRRLSQVLPKFHL